MPFPPNVSLSSNTPDLLDMHKCGREEPPISCFTGPLVTILVGQKSVATYVHRSLLVHYSGYFRGCLLNSNFKEAHENKIHLDTEDPSIFQLVSIWLYTGKFTDSFITIDLKSGNAYPNPSVKESAPILPQETLFALWIFGDVRLIPMLCNHVINLTFAAISPSRGLDINEDVPRIVFQNTTKGAAMRKLFVEAAAVGDNHSQLQEKLEDAESAYWMKDFLLETLVRMKEMRSKLPSYGDKNAYWAKLNVCDYHQHEPAPSA